MEESRYWIFGHAMRASLGCDARSAGQGSSTDDGRLAAPVVSRSAAAPPIEEERPCIHRCDQSGFSARANGKRHLVGGFAF